MTHPSDVFIVKASVSNDEVTVNIVITYANIELSAPRSHDWLGSVSICNSNNYCIFPHRRGTQGTLLLYVLGNSTLIHMHAHFVRPSAQLQHLIQCSRQQ